MFIRILEIIIKTSISLFCLFVMLLCYFCWNGGYFEGFEKEFFVRYSELKDEISVCEIEQNKISKFGETIDTAFLRLFVYGTHGLYRVYHIIYENSQGEANFLTYKFPLTLGIGAIVEDTDLVIEESVDAITIYYNRKPLNKFEIEHNPFSKKIKFEYKNDLSEMKKKEGSCLIRDFKPVGNF